MGASELLQGYYRFRTGRFKRERALYQQLVDEGQKPHTLVIACADSRVDPAIITDTGPGEIFVVRNVANLVPPYRLSKGYQGTSSAIEFAVRDLKVSDIVVMGHSHCGGVKAALAGDDGIASERDFIGPWVAMLHETRDKLLSEPKGSEPAQTALEHGGVQQSLENLKTFPWIAERLEAGNLTLHGWHMDITDGSLRVLDQDSGQFKPVMIDAPVVR